MSTVKNFQYCSSDHIRKFEISKPLFKFERFESYYPCVYFKDIPCVRYLRTNYPKSTLKKLTIFKTYYHYPKKSHKVPKNQIQYLSKVKNFQYCSSDNIRKFEIPSPLLKFVRFESYYPCVYFKDIPCVRYLPTNYPKSTLKYLTMFKTYYHYPKKSHIVPKNQNKLFIKD